MLLVRIPKMVWQIVRICKVWFDFPESHSDFSKNFLDFILDTIEKQDIVQTNQNIHKSFLLIW